MSESLTVMRSVRPRLARCCPHADRGPVPGSQGDYPRTPDRPQGWGTGPRAPVGSAVWGGVLLHLPKPHKGGFPGKFQPLPTQSPCSVPAHLPLLGQAHGEPRACPASAPAENVIRAGAGVSVHGLLAP